MRSRERVRMAIAGLLVVAALSVAAASGRKPAKDQQAGVTLRQLSASEVMGILNKFPEMVPDYLASRRTDQAYLAQVFRLSELAATTLDRVFPTARFYRGLDMALPPHPYLMATAGDKRYPMPSGLNLLLLDNGLKVTDGNMLELAKTFVTLAVGDEGYAYPEVAFLEATRTSEVIDGTPYRARLQARVGEQVEDWYFGVLQSQFSFVARRGAKGLIKNYLPSVVESHPGRGQVNPTPDTVGEASQKGDAQAERDSLTTGLALGSEPEEEQEVKVSLRQLPTSEVMTILDKFPEMVSTEPASLKVSEVHARLYPLSEVTAAPLKRVFPNVRFFKGLDTGILPPVPYVMAITDRKRYPMPAGLNQLLSDSDVKVTDANLAEIAKAVVILALGNDRLGNPSDGGYVSDELLAFPKITSLSAEMQVTGESHAAKLTVRIGDSEESWYVHRWHDQLGWVSRGNANGLIKDYDIPEARPLRQR